MSAQTFCLGQGKKGGYVKVKILGAVLPNYLFCNVFFPNFGENKFWKSRCVCRFFNQKRGDNAHETIAKKELSSSTSLTHKMFYDSYPEQWHRPLSYVIKCTHIYTCIYLNWVDMLDIFAMWIYILVLMINKLGMCDRPWECLQLLWKGIQYCEIRDTEYM